VAPLSARGTAGVTAAVALALLAVLRGERLLVPARSAGRLVVAAALNVTAWMGLTTLSLLWLNAGQGALLAYTMPIWAMLLVHRRDQKSPDRGTGVIAWRHAHGDRD
jgi:drug/metabolite transporter (DMT)-like permease